MRPLKQPWYFMRYNESAKEVVFVVYILRQIEVSLKYCICCITVTLLFVTTNVAVPGHSAIV